MWKSDTNRTSKHVIAMTPVRPAMGTDTVRAGAGALSFIRGSHHAMVSRAFHGCVEPAAIVVTDGVPTAAEPSELLNLDITKVEHRTAPPICVHIGFERRLESSATSGPLHVQRTLALAATDIGSVSVTVEPGWERIIWEQQ
jgi:hypothetical protein